MIEKKEKRGGDCSNTFTFTGTLLITIHMYKRKDTHFYSTYEP